MRFDFQLCYTAFSMQKETKHVEVDNDGWDFSVPFKGTQKTNHMAERVMILKTIAMIARRPLMDANYCR